MYFLCKLTPLAFVFGESVCRRQMNGANIKWIMEITHEI